jgi:hypothetical protein
LAIAKIWTRKERLLRLVKAKSQNGSLAPLTGWWRRSRFARNFDEMAITLSGLCLVHCVLSALLLAMVASTGSVLLSPGIHEFGLGLAILFGAASLGPGLMRSDTRMPGLIGLVGIALMGLGLVMSIVYDSHSAEILLTLLGVATVALAHGLNSTPACD